MCNFLSYVMMGVISLLVLIALGVLYIVNVMVDFYEKKICKQKSKERD